MPSEPEERRTGTGRRALIFEGGRDRDDVGMKGETAEGGEVLTPFQPVSFGQTGFESIHNPGQVGPRSIPPEALVEQNFQEQLDDPSFEDTSTHATVPSTDWVADPDVLGKSGVYAMKYTVPSASPRQTAWFLERDIPVIPGEQWTFNLNVRLHVPSSVTNPSGVVVRLRGALKDATGNYLVGNGPADPPGCNSAGSGFWSGQLGTFGVAATGTGTDQVFEWNDIAFLATVPEVAGDGFTVPAYVDAVITVDATSSQSASCEAAAGIEVWIDDASVRKNFQFDTGKRPPDQSEQTRFLLDGYGLRYYDADGTLEASMIARPFQGLVGDIPSADVRHWHRGLVAAPVARTTNIGPFTSIADITGLSITFDAEPNHWYIMEFTARGASTDVAGSVRCSIADSGNTQVAQADSHSSTASVIGAPMVARAAVTGLDGTVTYKVRAEVLTGGGNGTVAGSSTGPATFTIEDYGPPQA